MKKFFCLLLKALRCPVAVFTFIIVLCVLALAAAIASEIFWGLEPCVLCIYQRWGFVIAAIFAGIGLALHKKCAKAAPVMALLSGLAFLGNSAVAFYHTGVEQKWWVSAVEGCTIPNFGDLSADNKSWIENLMSAPAKPCNVIAWQDPIFGLSMANYNIALCLGMFALCVIAALRLRGKNCAPCPHTD